METPSSSRRMTRSQALAASNTNSIPTSKKIDDSEKGTVPKSRQRTGSSQPLIDITNDSPIIGIAMGKLKTPSSASTLSKNRGNKHQAKTPGSGEALLRGQVKTLLQRVEEEAEFSKKLSLGGSSRPFLHLKSPAGLLAPTPANTPQVLNITGEDYFKNFCLASVTPSPVQEPLTLSQMVNELFDGSDKQEGSESERSCLITRSLLLDFSEKSEGFSDSSGCSSVLTREGGEVESKEKSSADQDEDSSVWSIQAIASSTKDEEDEEEVDDGVEYVGEENYEDGYEYEEDEEEEYGDDGGLLDALCEGMSKISVYGEEGKMPNFTGRHSRFVYDSDDELVEGEEEYVVKLKGLPTPKGKHFRFPLEMEEGEEN